MGEAVRDPDGLLQLLEGQYWQEGAENLLPHHRAVPGHAVQDGGGDAAGFRVQLTAKNDLFRRNQAGNPIKMLPIDDFPVVWILQGLIPELGPDLPDDLLHELVVDRLVAEYIIWRYTGLTAVEELPEYDPPGR